MTKLEGQLTQTERDSGKSSDPDSGRCARLSQSLAGKVVQSTNIPDCTIVRSQIVLLNGNRQHNA